MTLDLPADVRDDLVETLRRHLDEEMELDVGQLKARLLLDFLVAEVGPLLHNRGVADAQAWMRDRLEDLEGSVHADPAPRP